VEGALIVCVLAYDASGKATALGPQVMGACRGLNLLLGMSDAPVLGGPFAWVACAAYGLFVAGVTWISRSEVEPGRRGTVAFGSVLQNVAIAGLVAAALGLRYPGGPRGEIPGQNLLGVLLILGLGAAVNLQTFHALRKADPAVIQRAVKFGILSLVWLHVGLLLAVRGPEAAAAVGVLWFPAVFAGRWIYST
jgi:4-hydroxybenzoate polyprenyltransferase